MISDTTTFPRNQEISPYTSSEKNELEPEVYFLRYAYPCSCILKLRNEIGEEKLDQLETAAKEKRLVDKKLLEQVFFRAFDRLKILAKEMNKPLWNNEVFEEYFRFRHNPIVESSELPEAIKTLCRIHDAKVIHIKGSELIVEFTHDNQTYKRTVKSDYTPKAKEGDTVSIHYDYAIEIVNVANRSHSEKDF